MKKYKTHTSTEVKNRWNAQHYLSVSCKLDKDLVIRFREKCEKNGIAKAEIIRTAIENFLNEEPTE